MFDELRRIAMVGSGVAELTRHRAEQMVKDLVKAGEVRREQAQGLVKELLDRSKQNRQEIARLVRGEIRNQIEALGVATKRDLERIERRVTRLETKAKPAAKTSSSKKTTKTTRAKSSSAKTSVESSSTKAPVSEAAREAAVEASPPTELS